MSEPSEASKKRPEKASKTSGLQLVVNSRDFHGMQMPKCLGLAIDYAKTILLSQRFLDKFTSLVIDCDYAKLEKALQEPYNLKLLARKSVIISYCCVHPQDQPNCIYLNPFMLHNLKERELNNTVSISDQVVFLTVKLVHEMSHLLYAKFSKELIIIPAKAYLDKIKYKTATMKEPVIREEFVEYSDLGEMMEKALFGGLFDITSSDIDSYMDLQRVGMYSSSGTLYGDYVNGEATLANFTNGSHEIILTEEFKSNKTPYFTKMPLEAEFYEGEEESSSYFDPTGNTRF